MRSRDAGILALAFLVAAGTFLALRFVSPMLFTGGGVIYPLIVAWAAGSLFAFARQPRHLWFHVAALGVLVALMLNVYIAELRKMFPPNPGVYGGPNTNPPPKGLTPIPPR